MKRIYIKPKDFCKNPETINTFNNIPSFIVHQKSVYNTRLSSLDLSIRLATMDDKERIMNLRNERFTVPNSYSTHWLYHLFHYGSCLIIENKTGELIGYKFEATYMDEFKTSFTAGTAVKNEYSHLGLGKLLIGYAHLVAMEKGANVNRGIIDIVNYPSVHNFINHFGGVFIDFEPYFKNYGPRLIYEIPLDQDTPYARKIDIDKVNLFIQSHEINKDYKIINCNDETSLLEMYQQTSFRIIALLPKGFNNNQQETYFATLF